MDLTDTTSRSAARRALLLALTASLLVIGGCDAAPVTPGEDAARDDAGLPSDASPIDVGVDAYVDLTDAAAPDAAVGDSGVSDIDAYTDDADHDGIPRARDCDDTNASVGATASRSCTSACAMGFEHCTSGTWSACDASTDCFCSTVGATRTVPCPRCGIASETCRSDGTWSAPGMCFAQQECDAGSVDTDNTRCGLRTRICDAGCHWMPWVVSTPAGECDAGATQIDRAACGPGQLRHETCDATCHWMATDMCAAGCVRAPLSSRSGADPVCIPEGTFQLGIDFFPGSSPALPLFLSEFYIDRNAVTQARYEACVAAAGCTAPTLNPTVYASLGPSDAAMGMTHDQAVAFCTWDGGRLVSEYEWEKSARGLLPDTRTNSWGSTIGDCTQHPYTGCFASPIPTSGFPGAVSPFGVHELGSMREFTRTFATGDYMFGVPPDPPDATSGLWGYTRRGWLWTRTTTVDVRSACTRFDDRDPEDGRTAFRCVY